jgi:cytochrome c peroxidase
MTKIGTTIALFCLFLLAACNKKTDFNYQYYSPEEAAILSQYLNLPETPDNYTVELPVHLANTGLAAGPIERDKAVLGRVLFYDKNLSKDGKISCGSCHKQEIGFSDDKAVSTGIYDRTGDRNSIALASVASFVAYYGTDINGPSGVPFFWDNRAGTASDQNRASLTNTKEMGMHSTEIVSAVQNQPYYQPLFKKAFGDVNVSEDRVNEAIAEFVNAMGSYRSKFDVEASKIGYIDIYSGANVTLAGLTASENRGLSLYINNCSSCHSANMGRPVKFKANNGLDVQSTDRGVAGITNVLGDEGMFKVPTLRNISITAPYMHDGRFQTLAQVIDHYSNGIKQHPNLATELRDGIAPRQMNFSATQKEDLIAFLGTLTDDKFIADKRFSNPFK